ncbi:MAG: hypothetical protein KGN16_16435 [Burkholderiales bacterium]|nr:hypothetical protein [Burkholderiales bacterium]
MMRGIAAQCRGVGPGSLAVGVACAPDNAEAGAEVGGVVGAGRSGCGTWATAAQQALRSPAASHGLMRRACSRYANQHCTMQNTNMIPDQNAA